MLEGVIYDLDGTLVDSRDDLADSVNAMLARLGLPARNPPVIHGFIGQVYDGIAELLRRPPHARGVLTNKPGAFARELRCAVSIGRTARAARLLTLCQRRARPRCPQASRAKERPCPRRPSA